MAITFIQQRNKQKKLILVFVLVVVITILVVWKGGSNQIEVSQPEVVANEYLNAIKIDLSILNSPLLAGFRDFTEIAPLEEPTVTGTTTEMTEEAGRENPFLPY